MIQSSTIPTDLTTVRKIKAPGPETGSRKISHSQMLDLVREAFPDPKYMPRVYLFRKKAQSFGCITRPNPTGTRQLSIGFSHSTDRRNRTAFYLGWSWPDGTAMVCRKVQTPFPERSERFLEEVRDLLLDLVDEQIAIDQEAALLVHRYLPADKMHDITVRMGMEHLLPFSRVGSVLRDLTQQARWSVSDYLRLVSTQIQKGSIPNQLDSMLSIYETFLSLRKP